MSLNQSENLFNSTSFLKIATSSNFSQFLNECCKELCGESSINDKVTYSIDVEITEQEVKSIKKMVQAFFCNSIENDSITLNDTIPESIREQIINNYEQYKNVIKNRLVKEVFLNSGHTIIDNFDWKLKWIMGTSSIANFREPLLELNLHSISRNIDERFKYDNLNMEIDLENLDNFINCLENISSHLKQS